MKKFVLMSLVLCGAMFASAADSLLYWMVTDSGAYQFDYAAIGVIDNSSKQTINYIGMSNADSSKTATLGAPSTGIWTSLDSYANGGYSFFVELMNDKFDFVAESDQKYTYTQLAQFIQTSRTDMPTAAFQGATFNIPEPTSGLMMLLGLGLLGLRRKKA